MKQIQILALVVALAFTAAAQSTSTTNNQNSGSTSPSKNTAKATPGKPAQNSGASTQTPPVQLKVKSTQPATGTKNAASTTGTKAKGTAASKTGTQTTASKTTASKTPAVVIKPVQTSKAGSKPASTNSTANAKKTDATAKKTAATTAKKPVVTTATKPVVTTPKKSVAAKAVTPKKTAAAKKSDKVKVVAKKAGTDNKKTDSKTAETIKSGPAGRRDPFVSVIRSAPMTPAGPACSVGKKCLYIPELVVKGIAKDPDGQMLAVVVSNTHRAYFLRENDQVFNGSVEKITTDSVVFREYATDHLGRETAHEVVKRIPKT